MTLPDFLLAAWALKDQVRSGWVLRGIREPESVADHSWGTALLCLLYASRAGVDAARAAAMALVHDLAEAETGDVAARVDPADRAVSLEEKARREREAMDRLAALAAGPPLAEPVTGLRRLWEEYEESSSPEAVFVRDMNLVDMCLQALRYELEGRYDPRAPSPHFRKYPRLDEFFATSEPRLGTVVGRELFAQVRETYREARGRR